MVDKAILVADWCGACKQLLDTLRQRGTLSNFRVIDVATPEGNEIAKKLGVSAIPDCIVLAKDSEGNNVARRCTDEETKAILSGEDAGQSGT